MLGSDSIRLIVDDGNHTMGYYCLGHVTPQELHDQVKHEMGDEVEIELDRVYHTVMRCIPVPPALKDDVPYAYHLEEGCEPGRGAFKATVFYYPL